MQTILVGINYSEQSPLVFQYALRICQFVGAHLIVAHYLDFDNDNVHKLVTEDGTDWREGREQVRVEAIERLEAFINKHRAKQYQAVSVQTRVDYGNAHEELRRLAKEAEVDLLILGKFTATRRSLFEDTPDRVISWTHCPVLLIPENFEYHGINRIIYASDFQLEDCDALLFLLPWTEVFKAELVCLHICRDQTERPAAERKMDILRRLFPQPQLQFRIIEAEVERGIDRYVALSHSDLVATLHQHRSFWKDLLGISISKSIASDVAVPMIVFRQY